MINPAKVLVGVPTVLRDPLLNVYREIAANYVEHRWEPSELNGGKFCEVVYLIAEGALKGTFAPTLTKPKNMVQACRSLEGLPANRALTGDHSLRILIPRLLPVLYDIRNNRGVGHVGGDVDPNFLDATAVYAMASWILAELIRVFHGITTKEAQETVDALIERKLTLIWEVEETKRVLDTTMTNRDQTLLLLYQRPAWVAEKKLLQWIEYSNASVFRKTILRKLHSDRLIEYDEGNGRARISPLGAKDVEDRILKSTSI
jgi:hypothetical protein